VVGFLPLHQHALDAAVGNEPQEGDEHIFNQVFRDNSRVAAATLA
jgi:hypothetical protein